MTEEESITETIEEPIIEPDNDIELSIYPVKNHGIPAIEIKCLIQDRKRIKDIMEKALFEEEIIARITLRNKWKAIPKLAQLGLINPDDFKNK